MELSCTIALDNYENIKITIEGESMSDVIKQTNDALDQIGNLDERVKAAVVSYQRRVLNKPFEVNPDAPCKGCEPGNEEPCNNCTDNEQYHCEICGQLITKDQKRLSMLWYNQSLCKQCEKKPRQH